MAAACILHRACLWRHAAAAVLGVSWALASHAESPMLTDDAGTLDAGGLKIEARHTWDALARSEELAFGFAPLPKVELGLSAASERDRTNHPADTAQVRGLSVKWVPLQSETGLSLGVLLDVSHAQRHRPSAPPGKPQHETGHEWSLTLLASHRDATGHAVHANLGTQRAESEGLLGRVAFWSVGYEHPLAEHLQLTLDLRRAQDARADTQLGLRFEIQPGLKIYGAAGRGNRRDLGTVGLAWEF
jgi:hypothetical protein